MLSHLNPQIPQITQITMYNIDFIYKKMGRSDTANIQFGSGLSGVEYWSGRFWK